MAGRRQVIINTPLGKDELLFVDMQGREELGRMFCYDLLLISKNASIEIDDILGQNVTVTVLCAEGEERYFNGFVTSFAQEGWGEGEYAKYRATVHPWLWFLTRTSDCRIFQEKTAVDIVKEVFNDNGFSDVDDALSGDYRQREYCVQYRETDYNFVSRLLEEEGIYYFFKHEDGVHKLVLADSYSSHSPICGETDLPFHPPGTDQTVDIEHVSGWMLEREVQPGNVVLTDYNFKKPKASLRVTRSVPRNHAEAEREVFDYACLYSEVGDGEQYALAQIEERQAEFERLGANTDARFMAVGGLFTLTDHPRQDQNREYLVTGASYNLSDDQYTSGGGASGLTYGCDFAAIESETPSPYRAARSTPKPLVYGPQTAVVVGPAGEEIYPDEYGRVKVQFHWDRYGAKDENSSCWVRVAQSWAGSGWGAQFIPRMGQEVMVEFLEGDPDRPIITGRVYNADNMPPYALPANKTQSGVKSRSTKGGSTANFNEIRWEDKLGSEEFYVQAEKDYNQLVKNDRSETTGHDRSLSVGNNKSEAIGNDKSITVGANHTEAIAVNKSMQVGSNHTEVVGGNMTITVAQNVTETIGINYAETVGAAMELTVGGFMAETVGAYKTQNVAAYKSVSVGKDSSLSVGKNSTEDVGDSKTVSVAKNFVLDVGDSITIKTGKASITMKKDGTIAISGKDISVAGSGTIDIKASKDMSVKSSKDITMKGKKILQN